MRTAYRSYVLLAGMLGAAAFLTGCGSKPTVATADGDHEHGDHGHAHASGEHPHTGPHGGALIELGQEEYHAELTHDDASQRVSIYILDGEAKRYVNIGQPSVILNVVAAGGPKQFKLVALPQTDRSADAGACFEIVNAELCEALDVDGTKARLSVNINGRPYVGEVEGHGHEDHEHGAQAALGGAQHRH